MSVNTRQSSTTIKVHKINITYQWSEFVLCYFFKWYVNYKIFWGKDVPKLLLLLCSNISVQFCVHQLCSISYTKRSLCPLDTKCKSAYIKSSISHIVVLLLGFIYFFISNYLLSLSNHKKLVSVLDIWRQQFPK